MCCHRFMRGRYIHNVKGRRGYTDLSSTYCSVSTNGLVAISSGPCSFASLSSPSDKLVSVFTYLILKKKKKYLKSQELYYYHNNTRSDYQMLNLFKDCPNWSPKLLQLWNIFIMFCHQENQKPINGDFFLF